MNFIMTATGLLISMLVSSIGFASGPAERFSLSLAEIEKSIQKATSELPNFSKASAIQQASALSTAGLRLSLFKLQGLGRLYRAHSDKNISEFAQTIGLESKVVEDLLGKWDYFKIVQNPQQEDRAAKMLIQHLKEHRWLSEKSKDSVLKDWAHTLNNKLDWDGNKKDHQFVVQRVADQLKSIITAEYDLNHLEENGLHELRRNLRWIPLLAVALDGSIQKTNQGQFSCPLDRLHFEEFTSAKYSKIKAASNLQNICYVSTCLYDEVVGAVGAFGELKDEAEKILAKENRFKPDQTPPQVASQAQDYLALLKNSRTLELLHRQLKNCLN